MYTRKGEVSIDTDCAVVLNKTRTKEGYIQGTLYNKDNKSIMDFEKKILFTPGLAGCIAAYINTDHRIFILHVSPAQAKAQKDRKIEPYLHLKNKLSEKIKNIQIFGHTENFDEKIFQEAIKNYGIEMEMKEPIQLMKSPAVDDLFHVEFNFAQNNIEVSVGSGEADDIEGPKRVYPTPR